MESSEASRVHSSDEDGLVDCCLRNLDNIYTHKKNVYKLEDFAGFLYEC